MQVVLSLFRERLNSNVLIKTPTVVNGSVTALQKRLKGNNLSSHINRAPVIN